MPYIVPKRSGSWELRESVATERGPRSRTLVSFRELTPETIRRAGERASTPLDADALRWLAQRAGAPVASPVRIGGRLLRALAGGPSPPPGLRRLLLEALGAPPHDPMTASERAAGEWLDRTPGQRGAVLWDLLLLADALPSRRRTAVSKFPRIASRPL